MWQFQSLWITKIFHWIFFHLELYLYHTLSIKIISKSLIFYWNNPNFYWTTNLYWICLTVLGILQFLLLLDVYCKYRKGWRLGWCHSMLQYVLNSITESYEMGVIQHVVWEWHYKMQQNNFDSFALNLPTGAVWGSIGCISYASPGDWEGYPVGEGYPGCWGGYPSCWGGYPATPSGGTGGYPGSIWNQRFSVALLSFNFYH